MITAPPGYCFVGADVDQEELWTGAIFSDTFFNDLSEIRNKKPADNPCSDEPLIDKVKKTLKEKRISLIAENPEMKKEIREPGRTKLSEAMCAGNKETGTDVHSLTAKTLGITREQAKVLNYSRFYGSGKEYAAVLLSQWSPGEIEKEQKSKLKKLFEGTKGRRKKENGLLFGGSESEMFNFLEREISKERPATPILKARLSESLEIAEDKQFWPTRVNWVVQSSGVDFLHLFITSLHHLFLSSHIPHRFVLSLHDDIRYLVKWEDRYRAALAFQLSHLLTRAMFSYELNILFIPENVAFFDKVCIDTVLRSNPSHQSVTPSNPRGLKETYRIPDGEALTFEDLMKLTGGSLN